MQIPQVMKIEDGRYISAELVTRQHFSLSHSLESLIVPQSQSTTFPQLKSADVVASVPIVYRPSSHPDDVYDKLKTMVLAAGIQMGKDVKYDAFAITLSRFPVEPIRPFVGGYDLPAPEKFQVLTGIITYFQNV
jgi:hypothetical protein